MSQYFTNTSLNSNLIRHEVTLLDKHFNFITDNGVFSKTKVDYGTKFLLTTVYPYLSSSDKILDVGCGYGVIGIVLARVLSTSVDMIDVNKRAIHLSKMNAKENRVSVNVFESDVYQNVESKYDVIITNPPIRAGKKVLHSILLSAKDYLTDTGILYFVIRKNHGAKSMICDLEKVYDVDVLDRSNGFFVIRAKNR